MIQNIVLTRGEKFREVFNLKNPDGTKSSGRGFRFAFVIYRRDFVRQYAMYNRGDALEITLSPEQTKDFDSNVLQYKIVLEDSREVIAQGILRVQ
jgi:hypothetical protein